MVKKNKDENIHKYESNRERKRRTKDSVKK